MFERLKERSLALRNKAEPVVLYIHERRGRFSAIGTVIMMYPLVRRPHTNWTEFEKDFRMYDKQAKK